MSAEHLIYVLRPNRTALWLPAYVAEDLKVKRGDKLTDEQFGSREVQQLLNARKTKAK